MSCSKNANMDCENPDYSNCNTIEPINGELTVNVTKLDKTSRVPLSLYKGKFGNPQELIFSDTVTIVDTSVILSLNQDYYAVATYVQDGKTIYAVDGVYFEKVSQKECDSICWSIKHNTIDVRLKN